MRALQADAWSREQTGHIQRHLVVSKSKGTPKYYTPEYGDPQKVPLMLGNPKPLIPITLNPIEVLETCYPQKVPLILGNPRMHGGSRFSIGLEFRVWGLRFRILGLGFWV